MRADLAFDAVAEHLSVEEEQVRRAARLHRDLGPRDPTRKHRSGLCGSDLLKDAAELRILIATIEGTIAGKNRWPLRSDWERRLWRERCEKLKRRYRWMTGAESIPVENIQGEKDA